MKSDIVETASGKVRGQREGNSLAFKGIRYAKAERFGAPVPQDPWVGVRDAIEYGRIAPQSDPNPEPAGYGIIMEKMGGTAPPSPPESEDCQFLNVWTANISPEALRPVMVWLHPGFFMLGSGASGKGACIAARGDAVVVSLNHRLNIFGYTHLDDLNGNFRHSGNIGQLDIVCALKWVRDNISRFGGDPRRVMVFGASGGGMKTAWLMASPAGAGLLHRAGAQSGPCLKLMERDAASAVSEQLLAELGLTAAQADDLRTVPVERLLGAYHRLRVRNRPCRFTHLASFAPVIDPDLLPRHPFSPDAAPSAKDIPMLLGWNRQDMAFFPGQTMDVFELNDTGMNRRAAALIGTDAEAAVLRYRGSDPKASASEIFLRIQSDWSVGAAVVAQADRAAALGGADTFVYRFDHPSPAMNGILGAVHSSETGYIFATPGPFADPGDDAAKLSRIMQDAWVQFAASGEPSAEGMPHWPSWNNDRLAMRLSNTPEVLRDPIPDATTWAD